ncbi:PilW family protein [Vibrio sp. RC27]
MAFHYVRRQRGLTLIELLIGLSLGSIVILCGFYILMNSLHTSRQLDQVTLVARKLNDTHQLMYQELRRAGHQINQPLAIHFSDSDNVIDVRESGAQLGMVYQVEPSGDEAFRNLVFLYDSSNKNIKLCDKFTSAPLSTESAVESTRSAPCFTLFDRKQIKADSFKADILTLNSDGTRSQVVSVELTLSSVMDNTVSQSLSFQVTIRSWM